VAQVFSKAARPDAATIRQWFAQLCELGYGTLSGQGIKLGFTAYPENPKGAEPEPELSESPESTEPEPAATTATPPTEPTPATPGPEICFAVGDRVELADGRTGEIVLLSDSGCLVQNGKPEAEPCQFRELRLANGTPVYNRRRGELGQIAGYYPDGTYRINGATYSDALKPTDFEVRR
jgi:hypothetical protein